MKVLRAGQPKVFKLSDICWLTTYRPTLFCLFFFCLYSLTLILPQSRILEILTKISSSCLFKEISKRWYFSWLQPSAYMKPKTYACSSVFIVLKKLSLTGNFLLQNSNGTIFNLRRLNARRKAFCDRLCFCANETTDRPLAIYC